MRAWAGRVVLALACCVVAAANVSAQGLGCTISATSVSFGSYNVFTGTPLDATGTVTYQCLLGLQIVITLGRGSSPVFIPRTMRKGTESLNYNLYRDSTRMTVWGDGTGGTSTLTAAALLLPVTVSVFGRVPARQDVSAGAYSDTVIVTVIF